MKRFLTFLLIILLCNITPTTAIQNNDNWTDTWNRGIDQGINTFWTIFNLQEEVELTPEQDQYLESHESLMIAKSEGIYTNLGEFLSYLQKISNDTTNKRLDNDEFEENLDTIMNYLKAYHSVSKVNYNYNELLTGVNNGTYNQTNLIIQINDENYIRYVQLVDIQPEKITLNIYRKETPLSADDFKSHREGGRDEFNIIVVNEDNMTAMVIGDILAKQRDDLDSSYNTYNNWQWAVGMLASTSFGFLLGGMWRCPCFNPRSAFLLIKQRLRENRINNGAEMEEQRTIIQQGFAQDPTLCQKHGVKIVMATAFVILAASVSGVATLMILKDKITKEKNNLNRY